MNLPEWIARKHADIAAEQPLSLQTTIGALSQRLWAAESALDALTCGDTGGLCHPDSPCRCCLAAEVEVLRAQVQAVRQVLPTGDEICDCGKCPVLVDARDILRALDGTDE